MSWKEEFLNKVHIKWLSKAKTAVINGEEITVLPYGYLTQAVSEAISDLRKHDEEELINRMPYYSSDGNKDTENGYNKYRDECLKIISDYYKD